MTSIDDFKKKQLEILHELDRVCGLIGANYYLAYGTCLGAIRHKGFIPWDDDIDVFLPAKDMNLLMENRELFKENYFLQSRVTDSNYDNMKLSLRDSSTAYFSDEHDNQDMNHGMYIDLYVLYPYPDRFFKAHKLIIDSYILRLLYMRNTPANHGAIGRIASAVIHKIYSGKRAEKKIARIENELRNNGGKEYYASFFGDDITPVSCIKFPQELFITPTRVMFEDFLAPCPSDPHIICKLTYGETYMEFPPEEKRVSRHKVLFMSCDTPYTDYCGKYYFKTESKI